MSSWPKYHFSQSPIVCVPLIGWKLYLTHDGVPLPYTNMYNCILYISVFRVVKKPIIRPTEQAISCYMMIYQYNFSHVCLSNYRIEATKYTIKKCETFSDQKRIAKATAPLVKYVFLADTTTDDNAEASWACGTRLTYRDTHFC